MKKLLLAAVVSLLLLSLMLTAVNVSAEGTESGVFPDRTFAVTRSPPGGPRTDTYWTDIDPNWSGYWWVQAERINGSGIIVEVFQKDGGSLSFVSSSKLRYAGDESVPVQMLDGQPYRAAFTPFGKQGTSLLIEHYSAPQPPSPQFMYSPAEPTPGETVTFDASSTTDPDSLIALYDWDFGDGGTASGITVEHAYPAGTYTVTLKVTDVTGLSNSTSQTITVGGNNAPVASFEVTRSLMTVEADASASYDPNGDMIADYHWVWGDGGSESTGAIPTATHMYATPGKYTILLHVTDPFGAMGEASRDVSVNTYTIDWTYSDFFAVPYGEWWDMRMAFYGNERPIGAECFSPEGIARGFCTPTDELIPNVASFPYTNWNPTPVGDASIVAPYRFQADVINHPAYTVDAPVILPTCADLAAALAPAGIILICPAGPIGGEIAVDERFQYVTTARAQELLAKGCPDLTAFRDGFLSEAQLTVTMDAAAAAKLFGVTDGAQWMPGPADTSLIAAGCGLGAQGDAKSGILERGLKAWLEAQGNGPYAIFNAFNNPFQVFAIEATGSYDAGTLKHTLTIDIVTWGFEVLSARWFYWGATPYTAGVEGAPPRGWWGMEAPWLEGFRLTATISSSFSGTISGVQQNHFRHLADAGPDTFFGTEDDVPRWTWAPILADRLYGSAFYPISELNGLTGYTYVHTTVGSTRYAVAEAYDYVPAVWTLTAGETQTFQFPTGTVVLYSPYRSPTLDDPSRLAAMMGPITFAYSVPASGVGSYDAASSVLTVFGPTSVSAVPATATGQPLESRPSYNLVSG